MATTLTDYIRENPCKGFKSVPNYFRTGDYLTFYTKDEVAYSERLDEIVTLYRSVASHQVIGCKIKGVRRILTEKGAFAVFVRDGKFELALFFSVCAAVNPAKAEKYRRLAEFAHGATITTAELAV